MFHQHIQPHIEVSLDGIEVEIELPPSAGSLATEFRALPYTVSECGTYEIIGGTIILRMKGTHIVHDVWPDIWNAMSIEQRAALRKRWDDYQGSLPVSTPVGCGDAPATLDLAVQGGEGGGVRPRRSLLLF